MERKIENKNIKIGIILSYLLLAFNVLSGVFYTPFLLSCVGEGNYGLYSFVLSITSWFTVLSSALLPCFVRFATLDEKKNGDVKKVSSVFFCFLLLFALLALLVSSILILLFKTGAILLSQYTQVEKNTIFILLIISSVTVIFSILTSIFDTFVLYKREFIYSRSIALASNIFVVVFGFILLKCGFNIVSIMVVNSIGTFFVSASYFAFSLFKLKFKLTAINFNKDKPLFKEIIVFSSFLLLNQIVNNINNQVDQTILGIFVTAEAVTTYTLAQSFKTYYSSLSIAFSSSFVPRVHEYVANNKKNECDTLFIKISSIQLFIVFLVTGGFAVCGREFINGWLNKPRDDIYIISLILLFINTVPLSNNISVEIQRAMNKHKFRAIIYFGIAIINIIISVLLVILLPLKFKIAGCVIGTVVAIVAGGWIALNIYNEKIIKLPMKKYWLAFLKYFLLACFAFLFITFFYNQGFAFSTPGSYLECIKKGLLFMFVYIGLVCLFNKNITKKYLF